MEQIKISRAKFAVVKEVYEDLYDAAEKLSEGLEGSALADEITELAEKIKGTFKSN